MISCLLNKYPGASQHFISKFLCARMRAGRKECSTRLCLTSRQCSPDTAQRFKPAPQLFSCCKATAASLLLVLPVCQSLFRQTSCAQHTCPGQRSHSSVLQVSGERAKLLWCVRSFACSTQTPAELGTPYARHSRAETKRLECLHPCVIYCWFFHMPQQKRILFWGFQRVKGQWPYRCTKGGHG